MDREAELRAVLGEDILGLLGAPWPLGAPEIWTRCPDCGEALQVVGAWHPGGQGDAYVVLGCPRCGHTENGGTP